MSKHLVKKIKNWLNEYNPFEDEGLYSSNISEIWLVGSRAKNTHQENSDYDIAVIFNKTTKDENSINISSLKLTEFLHISFGQFKSSFLMIMNLKNILNKFCIKKEKI
jgi:predicted nucleotidyltransferase